MKNVVRIGFVVIAATMLTGCYAKTPEEYAEEALKKEVPQKKETFTQLIKTFASRGDEHVSLALERLYYQIKLNDLIDLNSSVIRRGQVGWPRLVSDMAHETSRIILRATQQLCVVGQSMFTEGCKFFNDIRSGTDKIIGQILQNDDKKDRSAISRAIFSRVYQMLWEELSAERKLKLGKIPESHLDAGGSFEAIYLALKSGKKLSKTCI